MPSWKADAYTVVRSYGSISRSVTPRSDPAVCASQISVHVAPPLVVL
jgi:hypothetical protein